MSELPSLVTSGDPKCKLLEFRWSQQVHLSLSYKSDFFSWFCVTCPLFEPNPSFSDGFSVLQVHCSMVGMNFFPTVYHISHGNNNSGMQWFSKFQHRFFFFNVTGDFHTEEL